MGIGLESKFEGRIQSTDIDREKVSSKLAAGVVLSHGVNAAHADAIATAMK